MFNRAQWFTWLILAQRASSTNSATLSAWASYWRY
jgi:hypothetical protein